MLSILKVIDYPDSVPVKAELTEIHKYPIHNHSDLQIIYVLEGELDLKLTFTRYILQKNSIHIIHSNDVHAITAISEHNLVLSIYINIEYFSNYFPELDSTVFTTKINETSSSYNNQLLLREQIFSIVSEQYYKGFDYTGRIIDNTLALLTNLTNHFRGFSVEKENRIFEYKTSHDLFQVDRVSRIICYIYKNYPYKISLTEIAENEKISAYYLSHLFQKFIGISFRNFLGMARTEMSEPSLLATNDSISKLAQDVGFSDVKYYVENFKNWFGFHPKEYRKMFCDKTIDKISPVYKEYALDKLKSSIDDYTKYPVFKDTENADTIINVDFYQNKTEGTVQIKPWPHILKNTSFFSPQTEVPEEYYEILPQKSCVELAKLFITNYTLNNNCNLNMMDAPGNLNGIFAVNGLKKPIYHLLTLLEKMPQRVLSTGKNYIVTGDSDIFCIMAFNPRETKQIRLDFNLLKLPFAAKMTETYMRSQNTYAFYWSQLNFKKDITEEEFETIERMSMPAVSYKIISPQSQYKLDCVLEPLDIVFYLFEKA